MKTEVWKDIPGFDGRYKASTHGRIKGISKILQPSMHDGYYKVGLYVKRRVITKSVHIWVAITWMDGYTPGFHIDHVDGDKTNNCIWNLEQVTASENSRRAKVNGQTILYRSKSIYSNTFHDWYKDYKYQFTGNVYEANLRLGVSVSRYERAVKSGINHIGGVVWM